MIFIAITMALVIKKEKCLPTIFIRISMQRIVVYGLNFAQKGLGWLTVKELINYCFQIYESTLPKLYGPI